MDPHEFSEIAPAGSGAQMNARILVYAAIPFISAFIGWITNLVAVRMIFRPRKPIGVFGLRVQGLIPRRRAEIARSIGETVEKELLSHSDLRQAVGTPQFNSQIGRALRSKIDELFERVLGTGPLMTVLLSGEVAATLKDRLVTELLKLTPDAIGVMLESMEANVSFRRIVQEKIESFEMERLESLVYRIAAKELWTIEVLGAVLGFAVGVFQVVFLILTSRYGV